MGLALSSELGDQESGSNPVIEKLGGPEQTPNLPRDFNCLPIFWVAPEYSNLYGVAGFFSSQTN